MLIGIAVVSSVFGLIPLTDAGDSGFFKFSVDLALRMRCIVV